MDTHNNNASLIIGADIGGSHISAAFVDLKKGCIIADTKVRKDVKANGPAEDILDAWASTIKEVIKFCPGFSGKIGIAMPGPFDYENGICLIRDLHKYESIYGMDIRSILSSRLATPPQNIIFRNDAEAFLHGEIYCGAAKGYNKAFGITLGTGLGTAYSFNGATSDANLGVSPLYNDIAESYISTRWLVGRYKELTGKNVKDAKALASMAARSEVVKSIFMEFAQNLAYFVNNTVDTASLQIIVIGGNITKARHLFWPRFQTLVGTNLSNIEFVATKLGEDAALVGAACCFEMKNKGLPILE